MTDLLGRLSARALGAVAQVRPVLPFVFEPRAPVDTRHVDAPSLDREQLREPRAPVHGEPRRASFAPEPPQPEPAAARRSADDDAARAAVRASRPPEAPPSPANLDRVPVVRPPAAAATDARSSLSDVNVPSPSRESPKPAPCEPLTIGRASPPSSDDVSRPRPPAETPPGSDARRRRPSEESARSARREEARPLVRTEPPQTPRDATEADARFAALSERLRALRESVALPEVRPVVRVTIGRVDVHGTAPQPVAVAPAATAAAQRPGLAEYLKSRRAEP